jgi:cell division protein FtsI (penicillin-binding protein 3)
MLQLVSAFATLGNEGVRMKPRLVREILNADMEVTERYRSDETRRVVSAKTARQVVRMMEQVVEDGTAKRAKVPGYRVAGKTGTAKISIPGGYSATDRIGSFVGLIPAENPAVAIAVSVDTPTIGLAYGGVVAAPAFTEIAMATMRNLGIAPDPELMDSPEASTDNGLLDRQDDMAVLYWENESQFRTPDLLGLSLRDAVTVLSSANLEIHITGSGRVNYQSPSPGSLLSSGDRVEVKLQ